MQAIVFVEKNRDGDVCGQRVEIEGATKFRVHNLSECPEDAIIGRDLFNAYDYIRAVEYGIQLALDGAMGIEIVEGK